MRIADKINNKFTFSICCYQEPKHSRTNKEPTASKLKIQSTYEILWIFICAQNKTRTCTGIISHQPLKLACLPISPSGQYTQKCCKSIKIRMLHKHKNTIHKEIVSFMDHHLLFQYTFYTSSKYNKTIEVFKNKLRYEFARQYNLDYSK